MAYMLETVARISGATVKQLIHWAARRNQLAKSSALLAVSA
jgi:hypothetical protein